MAAKQANGAENNRIPGGYILVARRMLNSEIMQKPPLYLKVWLWLLMSATHKDYKGLKRGQIYTSIPEIQEAVAHKVGYRKVKPSKKQIRCILDWLRNPHEGPDKGTPEGLPKGPMISTRRGTHGLLVEIVNYGFYQDPSNYEGPDKGTPEGTPEGAPKSARTGEKGPNINKNDYKNIQEGRSIYTSYKEVCRTSVQRVVEAWNSLGLNPIKGINSNTNRHKQLMARIKEYGEEAVLEAIKHVGKSSFLRGHNKRGWIITFDWFIKPNNFIKVLEGAYDDDKWLGAGTEVVGGAATPRRVDERKLSFDEYMKVVDEYAKERF